jgi:hypothetical protein
MSKYLLKKKDFEDVHIGDRVILMADMFGISAGNFGTVRSKFRMTESITIEWDDVIGADGNLKDEIQLSDLKYFAFEGEGKI